MTIFNRQSAPTLNLHPGIGVNLQCCARCIEFAAYFIISTFLFKFRIYLIPFVCSGSRFLFLYLFSSRKGKTVRRRGSSYIYLFSIAAVSSYNLESPVFPSYSPCVPSFLSHISSYRPSSHISSYHPSSNISSYHPSSNIRITYRMFASSSKSFERDAIIDAFWQSFYDRINASFGMVNFKKSHTSLYQNAVIKLLESSKISKDESSKQEELLALQRRIEDLTMGFEEESLFKSVPGIVGLLINKEKMTAKVYLTKRCELTETDMKYVDVMGKYTLEALLIHVLGSVFNPLEDLPVVKVAAMIQQIQSAVKVQAYNLGLKKEKKEPGKEKVPKKRGNLLKGDYCIGVELVEFMVERGIITLRNEKSHTVHLPNSKGYRRYMLSHCYVMFNFDLGLLPIKLNLPMVCPPIPWEYNRDVSSTEGPFTFDDMVGGYLSGLSIEVYNQFRLLTSRNYSNFYITLTYPNELCNVLNKLQSQAFQINTEVLSFILDENNRSMLEDVGLLVNRNLALVKVKDVCDLLRFLYFNNKDVQKVCRCDMFITDLIKKVQRARYEDFIFILASAYAGYKFYLPAFMDFRGRIYRAGVLHFHERDLARSLIVFASDAPALERTPEESLKQIRERLACAAAFKYTKFQSNDKAALWYNDNLSTLKESVFSLMNFAVQGSNPFQFLAYVLSNERVSDNIDRVPVTQDASASAYQIMSYLLLNKSMGRLTNLLPSPDNQIQDLYAVLREELRKVLRVIYDDNRYAIIESGLTRKLIKTLFMPLIYGKTVLTMASDIRECYGSLLGSKDHFDMARSCHDFWVSKYPDIANLMNLLNRIGGFCSYLNRPVRYSIPLFTTVQDYKHWEKGQIWLYDRVSMKRHKVTMLVPTSERDRRKAQVATCVNFIHQKDAYIAMKVVDKLALRGVPVYTVHDNFITTPLSATSVPNIYTQVFMEMGPPLRIINYFLNINLLNSIVVPEMLDEPIPVEYLKVLLKSLVPHELSKGERSNMMEKVDYIVSGYTIYVNTVGGMHHAEKWNEYKSHLDSWEALGYNYSVHY